METIVTRQDVVFRDLGMVDYQEAWDYQEGLLKKNLEVKTQLRDAGGLPGEGGLPTTTHYLLFCEHPPVYTLGKSGQVEHLLASSQQLKEKNIQFVNTNRGGDITYHGPGQIVGYPILDLERFRPDIGYYLRSLEETIIRAIAKYGLKGERSAGQTGVWLDPAIPQKARKICAMGVRCSRWVTMHGFALNVNTDLSYFGGIIPCGITNGQVTSIQQELGRPISMEEAKMTVRESFEEVFGATLK